MLFSGIEIAESSCHFCSKPNQTTLIPIEVPNRPFQTRKNACSDSMLHIPLQFGSRQARNYPSHQAFWRNACFNARCGAEQRGQSLSEE